VPGRLRVVLVRKQGRLVGAAAFMRVRRWSCPVLTPLGGALSDFSDVLLDDEDAELAAWAMAAALAGRRDWRVVDLPEVRPGASGVRTLLAAWPSRYWRAPASLCLELPATPVEDLVRDLPSHAKKTVKRRLNQIGRLGLTTTPVPATDTVRAVADLLRLHRLQWQGRGGNPEHLRPRFARHLAEAVHGMVESGQAVLLEYRVADKLVAANLVVVGADLVGGYLYGADPELRDDVDIATLLVTTTMPVASERGLSTMSMLRGAESYKARWRPQESANQRVLLGRGISVRAAVYATGVRARRVAVDFAKARMPVLRRVRDQARRLVTRSQR
jgi:CelD/BcsL family acetyltransferase involved in cellulose biosynthesis